MKYNIDSQQNGDKIPYDSQPIYRQSNNNVKRKKTEKKTSGSRFLSLVVCALVILNVILCGCVISISKKLNNSSSNVFNISSTGIDASYVADKTRNSVVAIHSGNDAITNVSAETFSSLSWRGSGVIIEKGKGYCLILTCYHVVSKYPKNLWVLFSDQYTPIKAKLYPTNNAYSSVYDIALLKVESDAIDRSDCEPCEIADSAFVRDGDGVVAYGNPQGTGLSVSSGEISRTINIVNVSGVHHRLLKTTAPINGGNSGGGLFNSEGKLIGIVSSKVESEKIDNIAYAIPSDVAVSIAENIIRNDRPYKAVTGLTFGIKNEKIKDVIINGKIYQKQTIVVTRVEGSAKDAGFEYGDEIVSFSYGDLGDILMMNAYSLEDHIFNCDAEKNSVITFKIKRDGKEKTLKLKITEQVSADKEDWYA